MRSQVGLRKHCYKQNSWRWWNSSRAVSNPKRWCCKSVALNIPANLENSAVATGLENVSFHSNPKEKQWQRMLKLPHNCIHLTFLGWEDSLQKEMATHSSILAWKIPWMEEPGWLLSMGSQRVRHDWATSLSIYLSKIYKQLIQLNIKKKRNKPVSKSPEQKYFQRRYDRWPRGTWKAVQHN